MHQIRFIRIVQTRVREQIDVVADTAHQRVVSAAASELVVATSSFQLIAGFIADECVVAGPTEHAFEGAQHLNLFDRQRAIAVAAEGRRLNAHVHSQRISRRQGTEIQEVTIAARLIFNEHVLLARTQGSRCEEGVNIVAESTVQRVVASVAGQRVVAVSTLDSIVPRTTNQNVMAAFAAQSHTARHLRSQLVRVISPTDGEAGRELRIDARHNQCVLTGTAAKRHAGFGIAELDDRASDPGHL